jgi:hypothetical protein
VTISCATSTYWWSWFMIADHILSSSSSLISVNSRVRSQSLLILKKIICVWSTVLSFAWRVREENLTLLELIILPT